MLNSPIRTIVKFRSVTYRDSKKGHYKDTIIEDGTFIIIRDIPWWRRCFGLLPSRRIALGDGKTPLRKLKFS